MLKKYKPSKVFGQANPFVKFTCFFLILPPYASAQVKFIKIKIYKTKKNKKTNSDVSEIKKL